MKDNISTNIEFLFFGKAFVAFIEKTITKKSISNNLRIQFLTQGKHKQPNTQRNV